MSIEDVDKKMSEEEYEQAVNKIHDLFCEEKVDPNMLDIWYMLSDLWSENEKEFYDVLVK